jgi:uncharacterized membrane protein YjdF
VNPLIWGVENILVLGGAWWLYGTRRSRPLSRVGYLCCTLLILLHEAGTFYAYGRVNEYGRVAHFAFGLLITVVCWESFRRNVQGLPLYALIFSVIMWLSALYEIAKAYLIPPSVGFDSQVDMACAMVGCSLCLLLIAVYRTRRRASLGVDAAQNFSGL